MPGRPPSCWWDARKRDIDREYPHRTEEDKKRIVGGIWSKYKPRTKEKITRECETGKKSSKGKGKSKSRSKSKK